ncbi:MAG: 16S rRNA (guanine(966)-N(2))-methyltransferase RsmD [Micrococcales bacterium]|nr:16S rRNA (guanine(966)-N(2))-methyltransferase RsmD [Micrococcales bacterium]
MTRIIGGSAGGRRLAAPRGSATRPTADRVREALFNHLEHRDLIDGATVLDLYAGSGALGIEAASRGAALVLLVESHRRAAAVIATNIKAIGLPGVRLVRDTVERTLRTGPPGGIRMDLVLLDPPYELTEAALAAVLAALVEQGWLTPEAFVVIERSSRAPQPSWPEGLELSGEKRYGETTIWFAEPVLDDGVA